jgi:high-affinity iron transporter
MLGTLLHVLVGYSAQPAGIQVVFYLATIAVIGGLMRLLAREPATSLGRPAPTLSR